MPNVGDVAEWMERFAPSDLSEDWDNVGLLLGDRALPVRRLMTCLTLTPESADEAVRESADLVVAHHPLPFKPLARITTDTTEGGVLWRLAQAGVSVCSPHTAFDSAELGINAAIGQGLGLAKLRPITPSEHAPSLGAGRLGELANPVTLEDLAQNAQSVMGALEMRLVGAQGAMVQSVAIACGSGGSFLPAVAAAGADAMVTGEATFHTCLAARALGVSLVLAGHYASERFAVDRLAEYLGGEFKTVVCWASRAESDPLRTL